MVVVYKDAVSGLNPDFVKTSVLMGKIEFIEYGVQHKYSSSVSRDEEFIKTLETVLGQKIKTEVCSDGALLLKERILVDCVDFHMVSGKVVTLLKSTIVDESECVVKE